MVVRHNREKAVRSEVPPVSQKMKTVEKLGVVSARVSSPGGLGYVFSGVVPSRIGRHGGRMSWARILAYVTGTV
jgi:hypothetical protein